MKSKILNLGLIITSLLGYLEWGRDKKMFLFKGEMEILSKLFTDPMSVLHPLTLLPLFGQILLLATLFQKQPGKVLTLVGLGCIGTLLLLMFVVGILGANYKILVSTVPFLVVGFITILHHRKKKVQQ